MSGLQPFEFEEAIKWAKGRGAVLPDIYYGELQGLARAAAFSIAGVTNLALLKQVMESLEEATATGQSFADWQRRVASDEIPLELPAHRLDNIFRTNLQNHYARGRCLQQKRTAERFPWLMYDAVNDDRTRPSHAAMDGFIARHDDPVWSRWRPPCGYRCRCRLVSLRDTQAQKYIDADRRRLEDPDYAERRNNARPDPGWDYDICAEPGAGIDRALNDLTDDPGPARGGFANWLRGMASRLLESLTDAVNRAKRAAW